jgi:hypothetical protein
LLATFLNANLTCAACLVLGLLAACVFWTLMGLFVSRF